MIAGQKYHGSKVDVWSCGVIMFALICGYLPFEDPNTTTLYQKILKGEFQIPKFVSKEAADLLRCILCTDPEKRYKIPDIRNHPWFNIVPYECKPYNGLIVGVNEIPVSYKLLRILEEKFNFSQQVTRRSLLNNKQNHITSTYYLLQKKLESMGVDIYEDSQVFLDLELSLE